MGIGDVLQLAGQWVTVNHKLPAEASARQGVVGSKR